MTKAFNFDARFLKAAVMRMLIDPSIYSKFKEFIHPEYFDIGDDHSCLQRIVKVLVDGSRTDSLDVIGLAGKLSMLPDGVERDATIEMFDEMRLNEDLMKFARNDIVFQQFLNFLKARAFLSSHQKVKQDFERHNFDNAYNQLENTLSKIKGINLEDDEQVDWGNAVKKLESFSQKSYNNFELGIEEFDKAAGFEPQSFNIFMAASGSGKTVMSINLAVQAVRRGKKVFCVFVEDKSSTILRRLYSCYTGIEINKLKKFEDMAPEDRNKLVEATEKFKKYLHIEFIYGKSHRHILEKMKNANDSCKVNGLPTFEALILDYVGHIAHLAPGDSLHEKMHRACGDLKDFALKNNVIVFTHFQVNRSGAAKQSEGTGFIDMSSIASSFNSVFVADNIISINRSEENKLTNKAVLYVVKGREGATDQKYEVPTEFNKARFDFAEAKLLSFVPH